MKKSRLALRNRFIKVINEDWAEKFGARAHGLLAPIPGSESDADFHWRFVQGVAKDGKALLIYPILGRDEKIPFRICRYMLDFEARGAIVGCAESVGDLYCIVANNPEEYKRPKKSYYYRRWHEHYLKGKKDGTT